MPPRDRCLASSNFPCYHSILIFLWHSGLLGLTWRPISRERGDRGDLAGEPLAGVRGPKEPGSAPWHRLRTGVCAFRGESPGLRLAGLSYDAQVAALGQRQGPVRRFAAARGTRELRMLRIRIEDNGPIAAFRGRGVTGESAALPMRRVSRRRRGSLPGGRARCWRCGRPGRPKRGSRCATLWGRADRMWRSSAAAR